MLILIVPSPNLARVSLAEYIGQWRRTGRTETSKYPEEKKSTEIPSHDKASDLIIITWVGALLIPNFFSSYNKFAIIINLLAHYAKGTLSHL